MKKYILSFLLVGSFAIAQNLTIEETVLGPIETDKEWQIIEDILNKLQEKKDE